jgi:asparagine synthetase B (glutamine-hydrolysing)
MLLAGKFHDEGLKVALTGEGSDEWLAGYPWYKFERVLEGMGKISGGRLNAGAKKMFYNWLGCSKDAVAYLERCVSSAGGPHAFQRFYDLLGASRFRFYSPGMLEGLAEISDFPIMAAGGATTMNDLRALEHRGVEAVVLGTALYSGALDARAVAGEFGC